MDAGGDKGKGKQTGQDRQDSRPPRAVLHANTQQVETVPPPRAQTQAGQPRAAEEPLLLRLRRTQDVDRYPDLTHGFELEISMPCGPGTESSEDWVDPHPGDGRWFLVSDAGTWSDLDTVMEHLVHLLQRERETSGLQLAPVVLENSNLKAAERLGSFVVTNDHSVGVAMALLDKPSVYAYNWHGIELQTPAFTTHPDGDESVQAIRFLTSTLTTHTRVHVGVRCGLHCHVGFQPLGSKVPRALVKKIILVYLAAEHVLFRLVGPWRASDKHCMPLTRGSWGAQQARSIKRKPAKLELPTNLLALFSTKDNGGSSFGDLPILLQHYMLAIWTAKDGNELEKLTTQDTPGNARCALAYSEDLQTIEFRHCHGTLDPDVITAFGVLAVNLMDFARRAPVTDMRAYFDAMFNDKMTPAQQDSLLLWHMGLAPERDSKVLPTWSDERLRYSKMQDTEEAEVAEEAEQGWVVRNLFVPPVESRTVGGRS